MGLEDPGPHLEFERLVGTKEIVAKYQKMIYSEEPPQSDSSDEPFQFNLPDDKIDRLKKNQVVKERILAHRKKLTAKELISRHR